MSDIIYQGTNGQILVNNLIITDKAGTGECQLRAAVSGAWIAKGFRTEYETVTATPIFAFNQDSGKTYTNDEAIITTQVILPIAPGAGISYTFIRLASQAFRVKPSSGSIIYSGGQMATDEYLELASDGAVLSIVSDANGNWIAVLEAGTLTEQTP